MQRIIAPQDSRIASVQALRGIAACLVAAMHCTSSKPGLVHSTDPVLHQLTLAVGAVGGAGVDIFFVISGFIIMLLTDRPDRGGNRFAAASRFLLRRAARIYPLYWLTLSILVLLARTVSQSNPAYERAASLPVLLLATTHIPFQNPAWSLCFEMWFYTGTAALLLFPRRFFRTGLIVWALAQSAFLVLGPVVRRATSLALDSAILTRPQVLEFFLGCLVARCLAKWRPGPSSACATLAVAGVMFLIGCIVCYDRLPLGTLYDSERLIFWGVPAAAILFALRCLEANHLLRTPRWLCRLGDNSYSIYLWHYPVMATAFVIIIKNHCAWSPFWQALGEFASTLGVAALSYRLIERPFVRLAHRLTPDRTLTYSRPPLP